MLRFCLGPLLTGMKRLLGQHPWPRSLSCHECPVLTTGPERSTVTKKAMNCRVFFWCEGGAIYFLLRKRKHPTYQFGLKLTSLRSKIMSESMVENASLVARTSSTREKRLVFLEIFSFKELDPFKIRWSRKINSRAGEP